MTRFFGTLLDFIFGTYAFGCVSHSLMKYILDKKYDSLDRIEKWDKETQEVIRARLEKEIGKVSTYEFLSDKDMETLEIITNILIPQDKNDAFVKISEAIDRDITSGKKGVRYGKNPWPREFYPQGLSEVRKFSRDYFGKNIENLNDRELLRIAEMLIDEESCDFLHRFMRKILSDSIKIYYSHPKAWNEIGFPGPAYPEGYAYLGCEEKDTWEPEYEKK